MEYTQLGLTDLKISRIGFGCWAIGGHGYGVVDDNESIRAIHHALEMGINFFDTAGTYGFGHSEKILGKALRFHKRDVIVATKFGVAWTNSGRTYKDCSPKKIVKALEDSLKRLRLDFIPLYQIHWYDGKTPICDIMETLLKCQEVGKIRYIGCSNLPMSLINEAINYQRIESFQCRYNVLQKENENDMLRCFKSLEMGVVTYGTLARGFLTGKFNRGNRIFGINDTRKACSLFGDEEFKRNLALIERLKAVSEQYGKTITQVAIRFVLDKPYVSCALVGHKNIEQVMDNMGASGWSLNPGDMKFIDSY